MYIKWENGIFYVAQQPEKDYKIAVYSESPIPPIGYYTSFYWKETNEAWVQTWEINKNHDELEDSETLEILLGGNN